MEAQELKVEYEPTEKLVTYRNNAKIHTAKQVEQIKKSIEEFGFNDPLAVWTNADGESEIVEGHGRLLAAQELGIEQLPVIHLDRLTDEQRRAYTHVHNQLTMNTEFDLEMLQMDIDELGIDLVDFGIVGEVSFSAIDDLMTTEFASDRTDEISDVFNVTFTFPTDSREQVEAYIKEVGKEHIVDQIVGEAALWA